jgi:uncharacterized protein with PQ loop repeat
MPLAAVVGWGGAVLGTLTAALQLGRIRCRGADGVNATTWSLFGMMSGFWLAYGVACGAVEIVAASLAGLPFVVALLGHLEPRARRRGAVRAAAAVIVTVWVPTAWLGWDAGLLGIGVLVVATRAPQLLQLLGARHATGVSAGSWLLGVTSVGLWLAYYVATARPFAAASMAAALAANAAIVVLATRRHRGGRAVVTAPRVARLAVAM